MPDDTSDMNEAEAQDLVRLYFTLFNEIGIIAQLSRTVLEKHLPDGLIDKHFAVLNHLVRLGDGRPPLQIAQAFQVPKTSMTHTLSGLESRGLVRIGPNPQDGRSKLVYLTDTGRALREEMILAVGGDILGLGALFGPDQVEALLPGLQHLRKVLDENRPET